MSRKETIESLKRRIRKLEKEVCQFRQAAESLEKYDTALTASEYRFRELFNNMRSGVAIYEADGKGREFIIRDINRAGERIGDIGKEAVVGKNVAEVFPGIVEMGLLDVFRQVWETGKPKKHPISHYRDNRLSSWVENHVFRLPSGEVVAVYDDVTEIHQAREALERSHLDLEKRVRERTAALTVMNEQLMNEIEIRKRAENDLQKSEAFNKKIIENSRDCIKVLDLEGNLVFMSPGGRDLMEIEDIGPYLNRSWIDFWKSEDKRAVKAAVSRARAGRSGSFQGLCPTVQGTPKWWDVVVAPIIEEGGGVKSLLAISRDITRHRDTLQALDESEKRCRAIFETARDSIFVKDSDLRYTHANPAMEQLFNMPAAQLIGKSDEDLFGPEAGAHIRRVDTRVLGGEVVEEEHTKPVDGEPITFHVIKVPMRDEAGRITGLCGIARDITARKQAEEKLRDERKQLLSIFNSINQIVYISDPTTYEILYVNDAIKDLFQKDPTGGLCYREFQGFEKPCEFCTNAIIQENRNVPHQWEYHNPVLDHDFFIIDRIIKWKDGRNVRLEIAIDITQRKKAEAAKAKAEAELERHRLYAIRADRLQALGEMAAGMAHELNQPLSGVRGLSEHLLIALNRGWNLSPEATREKLGLIMDQADRMTHIIDHIRLFAREAGKPEVRAVGINEVIRSCATIVNNQFIAHGLKLVFELSEGLPPVTANPFSLEEVLLNLLINARHATEEGLAREPDRGASAIRLCTRAAQRHGEVFVEIRVIDQGVGIRPDILPDVFNPFFTTKGPDKGTGLGLSISKSIVGDFGGTIEIESQPGAGTTVTVSLPAGK